ncbi:DNA helicase-2 / ATP-dependent DNA helicase PcrA [Peptostreptococcus russellii]|uniref:DNA 3'-5' helicase n=1 Tax=Peptostreptococcus russellii TaxID=215200 RepID=A0A1H8HPC2_9FIRM|nr:ATP-dependent helicase [Peptostreptococcus russellii]SEN57943.1 DNA helicase-2 / ATP-dependent DNA helicase PcrA [Peptostreptococcus russellii]
MELNKNQKMAVEHLDGPCLVLAGPGSGKTRVIADRIIYMIENCNVAPRRILAISFTKASSIDMKKRTMSLSNNEQIKKVNFGTFHSSFFRILRRYSGVKLEDLISEVDRFKLIKSILKHLKISNYSDDDVSDVLSEISLVKNEMMKSSDFESQTFSQSEFQDIFRLYEKAKNAANKIDFDDMLILTYILLKKSPEVLNIVRQVYKYILIDEFQDINRVQFEVIKLIAEPSNNVFAVGDEDQSIYGFRGARPDFMMDFEKYFESAKCIVLDVNYRSRKNIVQLSQNLIKNNKNRHEKNINSNRSESGEIRYIYPKDTDDEANIIAKEIKSLVESENIREEKKSSNNEKKLFEYSDFAVIYRTNRQARAFVDVFMDNRIPFVLKDSARSIYDHWVSQDIISYLRIAANIGNNEDWSRIINKPFRYISKSAVSSALKSDDFFQSLMDNSDIKDFQKKNLEELYDDLQYVRSLAPEYGISYIRSTLDYDRYILEYCHERKIKAKQIVEILDELETSAKSYKSIFDYFKHIENVREEIKKRTEKKTTSMDNIETDGVVLTTMHSAKGLEFKNVYVAGVNDSVIPFIPSDEEKPKDSNYEEERRLLYVGITRAKDNIVISAPSKRFGKSIAKSRFLKELDKSINNRASDSSKK